MQYDAYSAAAEEAFAADISSGRTPPRMVILCGIPGCGKSTLAVRLGSSGWVRINQDDLGSRAVCEKLTREALLAGRDVVIDRCNFDREQRAHWVTIGKARHCPIGAIVFQTPVPVCMSRVLARTGHPTLAPNSAESAGVVKHIYSLFRAPTPDEGIDFCRIVDRNIDAVEVARSLGLL